MKTSSKIGIAVIVGGASYLIYKRFFSRMMTDKGITLLTQLEGFKNKAYKDVKGLWTIGVGHLIDLQKESELLSKVLTTSEVKALLNKDLDKFENVVNAYIKVPVTPAQKDALISLAFNIGTNAFRKSSLVKKINEKAPKAEILQAFAMWNKPYEIIPRRAKEIRLFDKGIYSNVITPSIIKSYFPTYGG